MTTIIKETEPMPQGKQGTLMFLIRDNGDSPQINLAMKKRGFGVGKWNGVGGKFDAEQDASIDDCALRETFEEIGVRATNPEKVAELEFTWDHTPQLNMRVHVYVAREWEDDAEPIETEEMRPQWYTFDEIPYDQMWVDDQQWLPLILEGKKLKAQFTFGENDEIASQEIDIVQNL